MIPTNGTAIAQDGPENPLGEAYNGRKRLAGSGPSDGIRARPAAIQVQPAVECNAASAKAALSPARGNCQIGKSGWSGYCELAPGAHRDARPGGGWFRI
jgi:hypothetical protein